MKFEVELSSDMTTRHENIPLLWEQYLGVLEEAKKNLEANKEKFKTDLLDQAEVRSTVFLFIFFLYKLTFAHDFTHARYIRCYDTYELSSRTLYVLKIKCTLNFAVSSAQE